MEEMFTNFDDTIYGELLSIVDELKNGIVDSKNNEMLIRLNSILKKLSNSKEDFKVNKNFNLLFRIKDINEVNEFLNKYEYDKRFRSEMSKLLPKLNEDSYELNDYDIDLLETFISVLKNKQNINYLFYYMALNCLENKRRISLESFKELTVKFVNELIRTVYNNPMCEIVEYDDENLHGISMKNIIRINENDINGFYNGEDISLITTIGHEITHTIQSKKVFQTEFMFDKLVIMEIKDFILKEGIEEYYKTNYDFLSFEIEAEANSYLFASTFFDQIGYDKAKEIFMKKYENRKEYLFIDRRYIDGGENTLNYLFDEYIKNHSEALYLCPQLERLYGVTDNEEVYLKSEEEMLEDYLMEINNPTLTEEQKEIITNFYKDYIDVNAR